MTLLVPHGVEERTGAWYQWERRGRGWLLWPYPVVLEPPFRPYLRYRPTPAVVDDGRRPTALSAFVDNLLGRGQQPAPPPELPEPQEHSPELGIYDDELAEFVVLQPAESRVSISDASGWLQALSSCGTPVSFELLGAGQGVQVRLSCRENDAPHVLGTLAAFFPGAVVLPAPSSLHDLWLGTSGQHVAMLEFGLSSEFMVPLNSTTSLTPDPLTALIGSLATAPAGGLSLAQVLFEEVREPWGDSILRSVVTPSGQPFFLDAPEITKAAQEKVSSPLYAVVLRLAARAAREEAAWQQVVSLAGGLRTFSSLGNSLIPLGAGDAEELEADILLRETHRSGMLLSLDEIVSFVHLPSSSLAGLLAEPGRSKAAPAHLTAGVLLGENRHLGTSTPVRLPESDRSRHMHVVGASGTGKSTLLVQMLLQDIEAGHGVGVIDPHGDLVDEVLARMPSDRAKDVILFDPADPKYVVGWNVLEARSPTEEQLLASDLVSVFRRLSTSWGDQMTTVLSNAVLVFLSSTAGGTLEDLRDFLLDPGKRRVFLASVTDPYVVRFWTDEFPLLSKGRSVAPILTRLNTFLRSKLIRDIVTLREGHLDFRSVVDEGKIFLGKLAQGAVGVENAALLGSLLVSKLHQVVLSRQDTASSSRRPFYLYLDEFHEVATPSMATMFSGVRKFGMGLVVAHQDLYQLHAKVPEVERAVLGNAHTRVVFRVGDEDAKKLAGGFSFFEASDLAGLSVGEAVCRVGGSQNDFNVVTAPLPGIDLEAAARQRDELRELSRKRYGGKREDEPPPAAAEPKAPAAAAPLPAQAEPKATPPERVPVDVPSPPEPTTPGRGGPEHKYLQSLITSAAQEYQFRATIEHHLPDGGRVDVALERRDVRIACEIAVESTVERELANVGKCLAAGFDQVLVIASKKRFGKQLDAALKESLGKAEQDHVAVFSPEEVIAFLAGQPWMSQENTVAGYTVTKSYQPTAEADARRKAIGQVLAERARKSRKT